jgi:hypothetical protein
MPASIIEDSSLLSPIGRGICIVLFTAGTALLFLGMSKIGDGISHLKSQYAEERVTQIADSIPEELSFALPPVTTPKTEEERILRVGKTEGLLNSLTEEALNTPNPNPSVFRNSKKLIALGVLLGQVHPLEAQQIIEEVNNLNITQNENGEWVSPFDPAPNNQ